MALELSCPACDVVLAAPVGGELVELATKHALSIHGHAAPQEPVIARIRLQKQ